MTEVKKDLTGYDGVYCITPQGKVFSKDRNIVAGGMKPGKRFRKGKQISSYLHHKNKLEAVQLFKKNKKKTHYIQKLMSEHYFDGDPVQQIDGNPMNNNILNLKKKSK